MSAVDSDPYFANNFEVELGADPVGFAEISGLGYDIDYVDEPGNRASSPARRAVGRVAEVSLRRGVTADLTVWRWVQAAARDGSYEPRTVTIRLLDAQHAPACVWVLRGARPTRWIGPTLSALGTGLAIEELVLAADSIEFSVGSDG